MLLPVLYQFDVGRGEVRRLVALLNMRCLLAMLLGVGVSKPPSVQIVSGGELVDRVRVDLYLLG